jgi:S-adenosylmethionine decarboxylase
MSSPGSHLPQGQHVLLDLAGVESGLLADLERIEALLRAAALAAGATPIGAQFHRFGSGEGVTGVILLQESHISIHTWPEHGFAALDIFMCGDARPELAARLVSDHFAPAGERLTILQRGPDL